MGSITFLLALVLGAATAAPAYDTFPVFSPDCSSVAFARVESPGGLPEIVVSPIINPSCRVIGPGTNPQFNPDGMQIMYLVESPDKAAPSALKKLAALKAQTDIYVAQLDGSATKQITRQGGAFPIWSPDGGTIAYVDASGALCKLPLDGGKPKRITSSIPCLKDLTWLPDLNSFVATKTLKGKMARYAFTPPSRTPVRISKEHKIPVEALAPSLSESGEKMAYLVRSQIPMESQEYAGLQLWIESEGSRSKAADIPVDSSLSPLDLKQLAVRWSADEKLIALACGGKIWIVELATGKATLISGPAAPAASSAPAAETAQPDNAAEAK